MCDPLLARVGQLIQTDVAAAAASAIATKFSTDK